MLPGTATQQGDEPAAAVFGAAYRTEYRGGCSSKNIPLAAGAGYGQAVGRTESANTF